jgi:hypothetical protein
MEFIELIGLIELIELDEFGSKHAARPGAT